MATHLPRPLRQLPALNSKHLHRLISGVFAGVLLAANIGIATTAHAGNPTSAAPVLTATTAAGTTSATISPAQSQWITSWTASPQPVELPGVVPQPLLFSQQTVRQIVRTSLGGHRVRIRLSNEFGTLPLHIGAAHIALAGRGGSLSGSSGTLLSFNGKSDISIPPGAPVYSDPVDMEVPALSTLAISIYLPEASKVETYHDLARSTTYISNAGNVVSAMNFPSAATSLSWFFLSAVEVEAPAEARAIVAFGDSITDGYGASTDAQHRWPDFLAARLQNDPALKQLAVLNQGISGNRLTRPYFGPGAQSRLDRDVLALRGVSHLILLEGINDIGSLPGAAQYLQAHSLPPASSIASNEDIISAYQQLITRAHAHGIRVIGATLLPSGGCEFEGYGTAEANARRQVINTWIRTSGAFDAVLDFDSLMRDPQRPAYLLPAYDSGDHLHPNDAGYRAMADSIDLNLFH